MLIDSHCHLFKEYYDNIDEIIKKAKDNDVKIMISSASSRKDCEEMLDFSNKHEEVYVTLGIHPEEADNYQDEDLTFIEENLNNPKVIAIGEIGLDYHYEGYNKEKQIDLFEKQLAIAEKYNLPVVVHSREATEDTINTLKKFKVTGVIHSFSGSKETAKIYIKMGFVLGINGVVTFKNAHIKDVIKEIGIEYFILETDSPFLTPHPYRGTKNDPSYINTIAEFLSQYLKINNIIIARITNDNVFKVFNKLNKNK